MNKKNYLEPVLEIIPFDISDIIITSGNDESEENLRNDGNVF